MAKEFSRYRCTLVKESSIPYKQTCLTTANEVYELIRELGYTDWADEVIGMFTVDPRGNLIGFHEISHGTVTESIVRPREVFKRAILENATGIFIFHNHPSGGLTPSQDDKEVTERIREAGDIIGIKLIDHIIVSQEGFLSMHSKQMIQKGGGYGKNHFNCRSIRNW